MTASPERHDPRSVLSASRALIPVGVGVLAGAAVALLGEPAPLPVVAW